ncbi:Uu.00g062230.m01.CDS01 [Anthostomella pinea]|uniref:Uu.00g062230.m01.CDS01 n=1 Tax=Anthostomella pinea TaxID=933095 RepID=A0AAI8VT61_9PEZI|nr:Uu.00g062230.m01.CDS01 [Anthostomella pinea]
MAIFEMASYSSQTSPPEPIAIVGSSCRFAGGATSPSKLWDVLCRAPDLSREVPAGRFNAKAFYHEDGEYHGTTNSIKAYWLDQDHRVFDAGFFNITPKEAEAMDPQQRFLLEVVYEAMESAGFTLSRYNGKDVGMYCGCMTGDYDTLSQRDELATSQYYATGNSRAILSNRISYFFNFQGPSMTIDTACSSSLVALHQAVLALRSGECSMACVTGVNLMITPEQFIVESTLHMLSPTGKCHMWDAGADGYARGEGCAALFLKPLSRALADGDEIEAIIREVGVNSDGRTRGITMPNPVAQATLIRNTYHRAGLDPQNPVDHCQYFEAHGTGTSAGDPREARAISEAFFGTKSNLGEPENHTDASGKMLVGSVKTVIGHTEGAAGLAGLLKSVQGLKHGLIPPNLHLTTLSQSVKPFYGNLHIPTTIVPWPEPPEGHPRRASVNSFGFGGTNAHAIIEAYVPHIHNQLVQYQRPAPTIQPLLEEAARNPFFLPLLVSASSQKSLYELVGSLKKYVQRNQVGYQKLARYLYSRRSALQYRVAVSAASISQALEALDALLRASTTPNEIGMRSKTMTAPARILGIFTGQGAQWPTMSRSLFRTNAVYRQTIRSLDDTLRACPHPPAWTLEGRIMTEGTEARMDEAVISQPVSTALQLGLVDVMKSLRIEFHTVVGHSSGEIAAAYAAGRLSARDAILISYYRGMFAYLAGGSEGQKGGMLAAGMSESEALGFCRDSMFDGRICVAASNAPSSVTLSGDLDMIHLAKDKLASHNKFARLLLVDTAYHSPHMTKPAEEYVKALQQCGISPTAEGNGPTVRVSSVHGFTRTGEQDLGAGYWRDNMVNAVQFHEALNHALSESGPFDLAVEIGPHSALKGPVAQTAKGLGNDIPYCSPLDRMKDDSLAFSDFLGFVWTHLGPLGAGLCNYIDQSLVSDAGQFHPKDLPTYPFDHSTIHYRESRPSRQYHFRNSAPHELLGVRTRDDNEHEMRWRNVLKLDKIPWLEHHSFQDQALLPASAYCVMALDAARYLLDGRSASLVEISQLQIMSGISIDRDSSGTETLFSLQVLSWPQRTKLGSTIEASFSLTSCPADGTTHMKKDATGMLTIVLGDPSPGALPPRRPSQSEMLPARPEAFYKMMDETGLVYSGPYRALTSIRRRHDHCSAGLKRRHPEDTTALQVSPATLDSCFQSAFLSYASPGDKSLWTSFLPVFIERVQFNLASLGQEYGPDQDGMLVVDTHMTHCKRATPESKAEFVVDIGIFNETGTAEVQVEGLAVCALADTQANDDYELYLHTVVDIDPTDEIVHANLDGTATDNSSIMDECCRVASFFIRGHSNSSELGMNGLDKVIESWTSDTREHIDELVAYSSNRHYLDPIRKLGESNPHQLSTSLPSVIEEATQVFSFHQHIARIVKQVAHRDPRMNILCLTASDPGVTEYVLAAQDLSFQSFIIGAETEQSDGGHVRPSGAPRNKVKTLSLNLQRDLKVQLGTDSLQDLVLLSTSFLENDEPVGILKRIRAIMRPGGFLIIVHTSGASTTGRKASVTHPDDIQSPPEWPDLLYCCGFEQNARNSDQFHHPGCFVMVRQLDQTSTLQPLHGKATENLLILGDAGVSRLTAHLKEQLAPFCHQSLASSLDAIDAKDLADCTAAIVLADLHEPLMSTMTEHRLGQLRALLRPNMTVLWLTCDARDGNPGHAATFGFLRTVTAEVPNLRLQILDLEHVESSEQLIATTFIRLARAKEVESVELPWTHEPEIHIKDGRRLIPRVVPLKQANDRINAMRRVVSRKVNTLQEVVKLCPHQTLDGSLAYRVQSKACNPLPGQDWIQVDYSSAEPVKLDVDASAYVCVGRHQKTGNRVVAMSEINSSYISCVPSLTFPLREADTRADLGVVHFLMRYLTAMASTWRTLGQQFVLVGADVGFAECLTEIASLLGGQVASYSTTEDGKHDTNTTGSRALHPRSTNREIRSIFPVGGGTVLNFLPKGHELSQRMRDLLPGNCRYHTRSSLFSSEQLVEPYDIPAVQTTCEDAIAMAKQKVSMTLKHSGDTFSTVPLHELQSRPQHWPFQIVDWRTDRNAVQTIDYLAEKQLFSPRKTYLMIGLTRDLGQSICRLLVEHGARHIVLASRNPNTSPKWPEELMQSHGAKITVERVDVTSLDSVLALKTKLAVSMPPVAGVINGAMVLEDRVFVQMTIETWNRCMLPKTDGSKNLDTAFAETDLEFFIMTSSFAAIGGHPGQSNYAAANMYMNGLAANRRRRGLAGSVLNIGVIYGLGFLQREKDHLYRGLEREGYPPISERDIHHMIVEAVVAGRPDSPGQPFDITTGLSRFKPGTPNPLHWHLDPRFGHFTVRDDADDTTGGVAEARKSLKEELVILNEAGAMAETILAAFAERLETLLQLPKGGISKEEGMAELGVDSLVAVEVRNWIWKTVGKDISVLKVLGASSIFKLCLELSEQILAERIVADAKLAG